MSYRVNEEIYSIKMQEFIGRYKPLNWVVDIKNVMFVPFFNEKVVRAIEKFQDEKGYMDDKNYESYTKDIKEFVKNNACDWWTIDYPFPILSGLQAFQKEFGRMDEWIEKTNKELEEHEKGKQNES